MRHLAGNVSFASNTTFAPEGDFKVDVTFKEPVRRYINTHLRVFPKHHLSSLTGWSSELVTGLAGYRFWQLREARHGANQRDHARLPVSAHACTYISAYAIGLARSDGLSPRASRAFAAGGGFASVLLFDSLSRHQCSDFPICVICGNSAGRLTKHG